MRPSLLFLAAGAIAAPAPSPQPGCDSPITRQGSILMLEGKPWKPVGANVYWLGLDENVIPPEGQPYYAPFHASYPSKGRITEAMAMVKALGGTMIRGHTLGVSTGNPLSVMPLLGVINEQAFDTIDWAVYQAREYGLRLLVPLTDNYDYYHGGKYNFLRWHGFNLTQSADSANPEIQQFYTNGTIVASFKNYIEKLLTHVNRYTGISYADDPTIFAYETGNELAGPVWGDMDVPVAWTKEIASHVKSLAPKKLVVDGTYGVNKAHLSVEEIDIMSDHFYPISISKLQSDLQLVGPAKKAYFAGEYDWTGYNGGPIPTGDDLAAWFQVLEQSPMAPGDAFWSLFGHDVPNCNIFVNHTDGFAMQYGNPENSVYTNGRIELVRQHYVKMSTGESISANAALPIVPCPASSQPTLLR